MQTYLVGERSTRFIIRKDAYRWQFLAPSPEADGRLPGAPAPAQTTSQVQEVNPPRDSAHARTQRAPAQPPGVCGETFLLPAKTTRICFSNGLTVASDSHHDAN